MLRLGLSLVFVGFCFPCIAWDINGSLSFRSNVVDDDRREESYEHVPQVSGEIEFFKSLAGDQHILFKPYILNGFGDGDDVHGDIRELNYFYVADNWELRLGISRVHWGVAEFVNVVDIINQPDFLANLDGDEKLGQPMIQFTTLDDWGVFDFFILPGFRKRESGGNNNPLNPIRGLNPSEVQYESSREARHIDGAVRFSSIIHQFDLGLHAFKGTNRTPRFLPRVSALNTLEFVEYYEQITQVGLDGQYTSGEWLWKFESLARESSIERQFTMTGGFEYTFREIWGTFADVSILMELYLDSRHEKSPAFINEELFCGAKVFFNDTDDSQILMAFARDKEFASTAFVFEAQKRISEQFSAEIEARVFPIKDEEDPHFNLMGVGYYQFNMTYHF